MTQRVRSRGPLAAVAALVTVSTLIVSPPAATPAAAQTHLRTAAEESGFERHTRHPELMSYLRAVRASSAEMRLGTYGTTYEGRDLPYAIFSRPSVTQPWEAWASDKPVLVLAANVHGNERTLRESLLIMTRELATPGTEANALLDDLVIIVAPTINPDGFEASEGGTRGNAWGIDLNRDYVKLEHEAIQGFVTDVLARWRPHLSIDGHNGGSYPYNVNYQCTSNGGADATITALCDDDIFPFIDSRMEENGYQSWYYSRGDSTKWNGGGSDVRIGRNYGGLANVVTILFESPGGQDMETGVRAGVVAYSAVLEWSRDNAERLMSTIDEARRTTAAFGGGAWDDFAVQQEYAPEPYTVEYQIPVREDEDDEWEIVDIQSDSLMKRPVPTLVRERPYAYILPRDAVDAVAMLRRHGITVEVLEEETELEVDAYTMADISYERAYNHDAAARVTVDDVVSVTREFPAGSYVVPTDQSLGRVIAHLLEPETNDNVVYWNTMDAWLPKAALAQWQEQQGTTTSSAGSDSNGGSEARAPRDWRGRQMAQDGPPLVPIFKLMERRPLPARIMD